MFLLLLVNGYSYCVSKLSKTISPGGTDVYAEYLDENDVEFTLRVFTNSEEGLRYKILQPSKVKDENGNNIEDDNSEENSLDFRHFEDDSTVEEGSEGRPITKTSSLDVRYSKRKGIYMIQIGNHGNKSIEYDIITSKYQKNNDKNNDIYQLRNNLEELSKKISQLGQANSSLNMQFQKNLKEASYISIALNILILFPIITIVVGVAKHYISIQLIKPPKKRSFKQFGSSIAS